MICSHVTLTNKNQLTTAFIKLWILSHFDAAQDFFLAIYDFIIYMILMALCITVVSVWVMHWRKRFCPNPLALHHSSVGYYYLLQCFHIGC